MTGLDLRTDALIEVAALVTDPDLNVLGEGVDLVIRADEEALAGMPEPYRRLDTAVLEALVLRGALHMSEDDISHLRGLDYSKNLDDAIERVESGAADAGFFMRATPVEQVREVAATGESMPPKSTYFYPKVPTGLVFNPLA